MKGIWEEILGQESKALSKSNTSESEIEIDQILSMRLSEFSKHNLALRINAEVLRCEIWLCSNEKIANQLREDESGVITYTVNELRKLYKLQPSPDDLRAVHNAKAVFGRLQS